MAENYLFLEEREGKGGRSRRSISFVNTREGSDKHQCKEVHVNMSVVGRKVEPNSTNLQPQPSFPRLSCTPLVNRSSHAQEGETCGFKVLLKFKL